MKEQRPTITDPVEFALIRQIYFEKKDLTDEQDRVEKKQKKQINYAR